MGIHNTKILIFISLKKYYSNIIIAKEKWYVLDENTKISFKNFKWKYGRRWVDSILLYF